MKRYFAFASLVVCVFLMSGCHRVELPEGLPQPQPTILTFTQAGQPLADAQITLVPSDMSLIKFVMGGTTDAKGILDVYTMGNYRGVPAGDYSVVVTKNRDYYGEYEGQTKPDDMDTKEWGDLLLANKVTIHIVGEEYADASTTPFKITVKNGKNEFKFDDIPENETMPE